MKHALLWYLRERSAVLLSFLLFAGIFAVVFFLYRLPLAAVLYPSLLCLAAGAAVLSVDLVRCLRRHRERALLMHNIELNLDLLPPPRTLAEADFSTMLRQFGDICRRQATRHRTQEQETMDYFAAWVHQIKTPIAAMGMLLQEEDSTLTRALSAELFRTEQYVDMVLSYLRLREEGRDYVFRETALDPVIRQAVRKFAPQFVHKRIRLEYAGTQERAVTDEKWLRFILEQLLSNAIKYTPRGTIAIQAESGVLEVRDTGIGIAPEDLPRVFERGFTGYNGRADQKATGLGLYLCRRAAEGLGITLSLTSQVGVGTAARLEFGERVEVLE